MQGSLKITTPSDREIVMTRSFNAPRHLVYKAMTTPDLIRRWLFLPPGWEMTACVEDVRVGGKFSWEWNGPDGKPAMKLHGAYREVVPNQKIVRTESFEFGCQAQEGEQLGTMEFTEQGGITTVKITVIYPNKESRDATLASGMEHGVSTGYDNLERLLASGELKS